MNKSTGKSMTILFFLVLIIIMTGCSKERKSNITTWKKTTDNQITLDWYVNFSWFTTSWGENLVSKKITEDTGVGINFISPKGNESEKLDSLISSDTLPDIITLGWWEPQLDVMINKDMVYALNDLAEQYDSYFWKVTDRGVCDWYTQKDGNLYCYPNSIYKPGDYNKYDNIGSNQNFLVRKDIYEAMGSPEMTTPKGFQAAVKKAVKMFPKINGNPLIPVGADVFTEAGCNSFDQYLQNFLAIPFEKNGKYYDRYTDKDYITWLKMFRELGAEGYLSDDIFIDRRKQMDEKLAEGRYFCMIYQRTDLENQQKILKAKNPDGIYIAVDGPKNSNGDDHILPGVGMNGWTVSLISKKCKHPDRAIKLFSYLISEYGQKLTYLGVEGKSYDMVDEKPVIKDAVLQLLNNDREKYDQRYGADNTYWMFQNPVMQKQWHQDTKKPTSQMEEWTYPYTKYLSQYEINFDVNSKAGDAQKNIEKLWGETLKKLLLAPSEEAFDKILKEFVKQRKKLGHDAVMEESTRQMNAAKEKVGMK